MSQRELAWVEFRPRPKKDGLHDSGYRYIHLTGWTKEGERVDLGEWHDHLIVEPKCNIDVTADGVIRIMPWASKFYVDERNRWWTSTARIDNDGHFT